MVSKTPLNWVFSRKILEKKKARVSICRNFVKKNRIITAIQFQTQLRQFSSENNGNGNEMVKKSEYIYFNWQKEEYQLEKKHSALIVKNE